MMNNQNETLVCGIVAIGPDNVIGRDGKMPWYSKRDFYHFRNTTVPWPCIFGRNTFDGLPKKPLPNRLNIVCSSMYKNELINGVFYANSLENALKYCANFERAFICGGVGLYKYALEKNLIDIMFLTQIYDDKLAQQTVRNPDSFVRFPFNSNMFFDDTKWKTEQIFYSFDKLSPESITTKFFKCGRINNPKTR